MATPPSHSSDLWMHSLAPRRANAEAPASEPPAADVSPAVARPRGYEGRDHETLGSELLAVQQALNFPFSVLGPARTRQLASVRPEVWYPIRDMLELSNFLDSKLGAVGLLALGRTIFRTSVKPEAKERLKSARDVIFALDSMYNSTNRGTKIGSWSAISFAPGRVELVKTTPHHCVMEEGILQEALASVQVPVTITQSRCLRRGDDHCRFILTSVVTDQRWSGAPPAAAAGGRAGSDAEAPALVASARARPEAEAAAAVKGTERPLTPRGGPLPPRRR